MPQIPFAFKFESECQFGNKTVTELSFNHSDSNCFVAKLPFGHSTNFPNWLNGNSVTVLSPNCHLAIKTQIQMHTESEVFRKHDTRTLECSFYCFPVVQRYFAADVPEGKQLSSCIIKFRQLKEIKLCKELL